MSICVQILTNISASQPNENPALVPPHQRGDGQGGDAHAHQKDPGRRLCRDRIARKVKGFLLFLSHGLGVLSGLVNGHFPRNGSGVSQVGCGVKVKSQK